MRNELIHYSTEPGYHVHPEMELTVIKGGGGTRIVNDIKEKFGSLDVIFSPCDTPHCWIFDPAECQPGGMVDDGCCQFNPSLLSGLSQLYPEFTPMTDFFSSLRQAIQLTGDTALYIAGRFDTILDLSGMRQVLALLDIFTMIYEKREYRTIGMPLPPDVNASRPRVRLHLIDRIIAENYNRRITLSEISAAVGMSPTSFCNSFKAMTGTTFNRYLTDYRMRIASQLLTDTTLNISQIGYQVGYSDVAHFTRSFTARFRMPPSAFRHNSATDKLK